MTHINQDHKCPIPQYTDVGLYQKARAIREWLLEISGLIPRLNENPNSFYNCTLDGLVLVEYYGGPSLIGTPLGGWACTGGGASKADWLPEAKDRLGLISLVEGIQTEQGFHGPVWAITKDLDGNPLPNAKYEVLGSAPSNGFTTRTLLDALPADVLRTACAEAGCEPQDEERRLEDGLHWHKYNYACWAWKQMKTKIGYHAWDDTVDPDYHLTSVYLENELEKLVATLDCARRLPFLIRRLLQAFKVLSLHDSRSGGVLGLWFIDGCTDKVMICMSAHLAKPKTEFVHKMLAARVHGIKGYELIFL